jgi:hypothetical protein
VVYVKDSKLEWMDGNELTVSLKDYPHPERKSDVSTLPPNTGCDNTFHWNGAVKEGGCPRHAHFTKGNIRDAK